MDLKRLLIILRRRKWWIIQAVLVIALGTAYFTNQLPNVYNASAKLLIEPRDMQQSVVGDLAPVAQMGFVDELTILKTQTQLFNTKAFSERVLAALQKANPDDRSLWAIGSLAGRVRAKLLEDTRIIEVSSEDSDPVRVARIVNVAAEVFVQDAAKHNRSNAEKARKFVEGQLALTQRRLTDVEAKTSQFKEANGIFHLNSQLETLIKRRDALTDDESKAESELKQLQAQQQAIRQRLTLSAQEIRDIGRLTSDSELSTLRNQRLDLQSRLWSVDRGGSDNLQVANLRRQLDQLDRTMATKVTSVLGKRDHASLAKRLSSLDPLDQDLARQLIGAEIRAASLSEQQLVSSGARAIAEQQLRGFPQREKYLAAYLRDGEALSENFKTLSAKLEELRIAEAARVSPVSLIEPAVPPSSPVSPNKTRNLISGVMVGLAFGILLALFIDSFDETIWNKEELSYLFQGVPVLAGFPPLRSHSTLEPLQWHQALELSENELQVLDVCRSLRTNLSFLLPASLPSLVLAIVGTGRDEGRARLLMAIAASYALTDKSVCVVDADLRHPVIHTEMGQPNDTGLSDVLVGHASIELAIKSTGWPNLAVVTAGPPSLMPTELLERGSFKTAIAVLREKFDVVILNTPQADSIDALLVGSIADALLLMVRLESDTRARLTDLKAQFAVTSLKPAGLVCWHLPKGINPYWRRKEKDQPLPV